MYIQRVGISIVNTVDVKTTKLVINNIHQSLALLLNIATKVRWHGIF